MNEIDQIKESFEKNTKHEFKHGLHHISCIKGNWGVSCRQLYLAKREAKHYFIQYYQDGEYDE